ncbi:MAG: hypothetical protein PHS86_03230 [Syntrophaceae bacterium]|nr:hypothetical protein [Syntrophaceae bacterium]
MGLKIHANPKLNPIDSKFFLKLINELTQLSDFLVSGNLFNAGYLIGRLQGDLVILHEQIEMVEKGFNEDDEEEDEEEDGDVDYWRSGYHKLEEDIEEQRQNIKDALYENSCIRNELNSIKEIVLKLYNDDQIHPNQRGEIAKVLVNCEDLMYGLDGKIVKKPRDS